MNILITGGAGYIGNHLVPLLHNLKEVEEVIVYDNLSRRELNFFFGKNDLPKVSFIQGDILDSDRLENAIKGVDVVIHLAALVSQPYNHLQNLQYEQVNRWGTLNVVRAIQKSRVKSVLYLSSAAVFGFKENLDKTEALAPSNAYARSKYNGEQYANLLAEDFSTCVLRAGNVFGFNPCFGIEGVLNTFMFDGLVKGEIKIFGDGTQLRPFVSLSSLGEIILNWLANPSSKTTLAVDFNASMNELKDWLLAQKPELNYQYLNQNQSFPSQSFANVESQEKRDFFLEEAWKNFQNELCVKTN